MTLDEFENQVISACTASPVVASVSISGIGITWVRIRAYLIDGSFLEAFHNEATGKTSFALVLDGRRIFGADNAGGWHWHPFNTPDEHQPTEKQVDFQSFFRRVEEQLKK